MQTRRLGYTDLYLSTVGLGTAAMGGGRAYGWDPRDDNESIAAIRYALELGINWIDTAPIYGLGRAEEIVARAVAGRRHEVIIATKCGWRWNEVSGRDYSILKAESIRSEVEASLRRLNTDAIDLLQIHRPNPDEEIEEGWAAIVDLIREGKVRYSGVSNFSVGQLERVQAIHPVASSQPSYSMLDRGIEREHLPYCASRRIGVIAYSPLQSGLLTGNFTRETVANLPGADWRRKTPHFREPNLSANLAFIEKLRPIAELNGRTLPRLAVAWVLRRPEVTAAIIGARRLAQIEEMGLACDWELPEEDAAEIDALTERHLSRCH